MLHSFYHSRSDHISPLTHSQLIPVQRLVTCKDDNACARVIDSKHSINSLLWYIKVDTSIVTTVSISSWHSCYGTTRWSCLRDLHREADVCELWWIIIDISDKHSHLHIGGWSSGSLGDTGGDCMHKPWWKQFSVHWLLCSTGTGVCVENELTVGNYNMCSSLLWHH